MGQSSSVCRRTTRGLRAIAFVLVLALLVVLQSVSTGTARATAPAGTQTGGETVYTSQLYGYQLTYDAAQWSVSKPDDDPNDAYDRLNLTNGVSTISLVGDPDYDASQLGACVTSAASSVKGADGISEFALSRGSRGDEAGRSYAEYDYVYNTRDYVEYLECRDMGQATLVIYHTATADVYDDEVAARQDLLSGLSVGSDAGQPANAPSLGVVTSPTAGNSNNSNYYTDSDNGWSLTWDDSWTQSASPDSDGYLGLDNGTSSVFISVLPDTNDVHACLKDQLWQLVEAENVSAVSIMKQGSTNVEGGDDQAAYVAFRYSYRTSGALVKMVDRYDCKVLPDGKSMLMVEQVVAYDDFSGQVQPMAALFKGLTIGQQTTSGPVATPPANQPSTSGKTASAENSYASPSLGYSITWDDTWTRQQGVSEDDLELTNGTSTISFMPFPNGDAQGCAEGIIKMQGILYTDLQQAADNNGKPLAGGDATDYYVVYTGTDANIGNIALYVECQSLDSGNSIVIMQKVPADSYNDQLDARSALLDNLVLPTPQ